MKIALFGGAFDPPHLGHQRVGQEMVGRQVVDEVWYVPVFKHPWAERLGKLIMAPYHHRKKMVELILPAGTRIKEYRDVSFAYHTLVYFTQLHPSTEFSWVIGSEYLPDFADWKLADEILAEFAVYVYPRQDHPLAPVQSGMKALTGFPQVKASSTLVKDRLKQGLPVEQLLDERVVEYIESHSLYQ